MLREVDATRMRAKRARTPEEMDDKARQVASLRLGDIENGVEPLTISETQRTMGFAKNDSVYLYQTRAVKLGLIAINEKGDPILPKKTEAEKWRLFTKTNDLANETLIKQYLLDEGEKDVGKTQTNFSWLERLFNTTRITPRMLIEQHSKKYVQSVRDDYIRAYRAGEDWRRSPNSKRGDWKLAKLGMNYAIASFCGHHNISWIRGDPNMERKVLNHGKYAEIRLLKENPNEYEVANKWLIENYGLDSNLYRWFWVGVESCARSGVTVAGSGLYGMKLQWTEIKNVDKKTGEVKETLVMRCFESKTKKVRDGMWDKFIKRPETIESLRALKKRGGTRIYETELTKSKFMDLMNEGLRELYAHLGKDPDSFFFAKPSHTLRHLGAHYWLQKGEYKNHVEVALVGGWNTIDELIKSYGAIPPEKIVEFLDRYDYQ